MAKTVEIAMCKGLLSPVTTGVTMYHTSLYVLVLGGEVRECEGCSLLGKLEAGTRHEVVVFVAITREARYDTKDESKLFCSRFRH